MSASGGITKFKLLGEQYEIVSGTVMPFNTMKTPVNSLSGTPGHREEYVPPKMDLVLQSTSTELGTVIAADLQKLSGAPGEDAVVETNNGVVYLMHNVYVSGEVSYEIDSGEISFQLVAHKAEQLYVRN